MPRNAKRTQTGAPAQPIGAVPGQTYGMGVQQMELQRQLPAPQAVQPGQPAVQAPPSTAGIPPDSGAPAAPPMDPMAAAAAMQPGPGLFNEPGGDDLPVTAGLSRGPGPGPSALGLPAATPLADTFRELSNATGDPYFLRLLEQNGLA